MARDCPDRQRGTDWRNYGPRRQGDAVDREMEQLMQELGGGSEQRLLEAGPDAPEESRDHDRSLKPWQRGPTGGPAPWQRRDNSFESLGPRDHGAPSGPHRNAGGPPPWAASGPRHD
ncbi:hypothetical protein KEM54_004763, partial [Ascosphaera aggregata]